MHHQRSLLSLSNKPKTDSKKICNSRRSRHHSTPTTSSSLWLHHTACSCSTKSSLSIGNTNSRTVQQQLRHRYAKEHFLSTNAILQLLKIVSIMIIMTIYNHSILLTTKRILPLTMSTYAFQVQQQRRAFVSLSRNQLPVQKQQQSFYRATRNTPLLLIKQQQQRLWMTTSSSSTPPTSSTTTTTEVIDEVQEQSTLSTTVNPTTKIVGLYDIQNAVQETLRELYGPPEMIIPKGRVLSKLFASMNNESKKGNNKKKKAKKSDDIDSTAAGVTVELEDSTATSTPKELSKDEITTILNTELELLQQQQSSSTVTQYDVAVTPATRTEFGDYQCNVAMNLASILSAIQQYDTMVSTTTTPNSSSSTTTQIKKITPRSVAEEIVPILQTKLQSYIELPMDIAGPGFINIKFHSEYLTNALRTILVSESSSTDTTNVSSSLSSSGSLLNMMIHTERLGIPKTTSPKTIVVDYSSPNIAKEMHVGHLRSTIIGDTLANVLEFLGHNVVRLNHIGDWGTQFGMLVEHLRDEYPEALDPNTSKTIDLGDLVVLYKAAKKRFDEDDAFKVRARDGVVQLQSGEASSLAAWQTLCATSRIEYQKIYDLLNIRNLQERGESFYNPFLSNVIDDLKEQNLLVESDGALTVYVDGYTNRDGTALPMIVRKSDGGYNYATTDLAAIQHRTSMEDGIHADRVLYVTDAGQAQHFDMVFQVAKKAKFVPNHASLEHVPFGLVQGEDGKKFATRSGDTVKLKDLLNESIHIAGKDLRDRYMNSITNQTETETQDEFLHRVDRVARIVGIGAVKYADLSMNRESNYRFSYDRMLSLNGNTAPYMLYAYARICSIVRKASGQSQTDIIMWPPVADEILITHESEYELIRNIVKCSDVLYDVERDLYPNRICDYLFETSQKFNQFYENCSVNNAETSVIKASRLSLCVATARTIRLLLTLLGIEVVDKL